MSSDRESPQPALMEFDRVDISSFFDESNPFHAQPDDIIIITFPKTGTTWMGQIVSNILHDADQDVLNSSKFLSRLPYIEIMIPDQKEALLQARDQMKPPRLFKTHLPLQALPQSILDSGCKIIYVSRNPKDTAVSMFHFLKIHRLLNKPKSWSDFITRYIAMSDSIYCWSKHVKDYWDAKSKLNLHWVLYEDLKKDPKKEVLDICRYIGKEVSEELLDKIIFHSSFDEMKQNKACNGEDVPVFDLSVSAFIRKGQVGSWKETFTVAESEAMDATLRRDLESYPELKAMFGIV